jgi:eukaryotic-like serine/threonine-protein kinase
MAERITGEEATMAVTPDAAASRESMLPGASTPPRHVFGSRYEILGLVGSGGMGTVYRARDIELDEVVALKLLRRDLLDKPGMLDRFRQEVKLARRVTHRNVARTFDIGEGDGEKFLTMELVEGEALSAKIAREGALPLDFVTEVAAGMCAGLVAAHEAGIVHRDLKPDNVLIASDGRVVITDFGIARAVYDASRAATVGLALGTPAYMAPEQVEGATDLDARTDIYALGAMLYECLTGERPWTGDSVWSLAAARLMQPPPDPRVKRPELPPAAAELVLRCMARRREDRFASAAQAAVALAGLTMPAGAARRPSTPPAGPPALDSGTKTVAVLPFRNAGAKDDDYIAEGLSDDLIDALSMTPGLRVLARDAVARSGAGQQQGARDLGRELRVDVVVDGSVRRAGEQLRVSVRVISVADGFQLWAKRFDRADKDVLSVSDEAADAISGALTLRRRVPARSAPGDPRAVDLYLRARHALHAGWRENVARAIELFEEALALAPDDPTILTAYANAQLRRLTFNSTEPVAAIDAEEKVRASAEKALSLAPHMGEARATLANLEWSMGNPVGCARQLREAVRISPSSSDVNDLFGRMLIEAGHPQRGIALLSAVIAVEPQRNLVHSDLARARALMGDWSAYEAAVENPPTDEHANIRYMLLARLTMWRRDRAMAQVLRRQIESRNFALVPEVLAILDMILTGQRGYELLKNLDEWGRIIGRARRRPAFFRQLAAEGLAFVGDVDLAEKALFEAEGLGLVDLTWIDRCPVFSEMHESPGFAAVRTRVAARAKEVLDVLEGRAE